MRHFVRGRIATALERARPMLEDYIGEHLQYPFGFPYRFIPAAVQIRDIGTFKIVALAKADYPPVQIEVLLKAWLANRAAQIGGGWDPGMLDADVELIAHGAVGPDGTYSIEARSSVLKAWWRDMAPVASQWLPAG